MSSRSKVGLGWGSGETVAGTGVSAGERHRAGGERVSALRFASPHPLLDELEQI
ncbi:hypothetical protein ACFV9D_03175 [Streptomyces sp. NPDC059875]|uniref:hypothetical protein n=1 Tax=unclassified Streptomyces TaxID=2593676 RepID=UPI003660A1A6